MQARAARYNGVAPLAKLAFFDVRHTPNGAGWGALLGGAINALAPEGYKIDATAARVRLGH